MAQKRSRGGAGASLEALPDGRLKPVLPEHRVGLAAFSLEMHGVEKQKTPKAIEKYFCLGFGEQL
jgi:hypothetical protein